MALLSRLLGSAEDAQDAYQETWCAIWKALPRLRSDSDAWPYIRQAAVRKALDRIRQRKVRPVEESLEAGQFEAPADLTGTHVDLAALNREQRICLTLFFWEGCSVNEIASELGVPAGTVKTWMFRARKQLREQLSDGE